MAITFPNRPCPKCGKPIHVRVKSHDCGWTASAKSSPKAKPAKIASSNGKISKMEAVRRVLGTSGKDTMPLDIQDQLRKKFNIKMDASTISNYKSMILKQGKRKKPGRKPGRPAASLSSPKMSKGGSVSLEDIKVVKELAERLGVEKLRQLAEVLA
jgi:hypothetical protein